MRCKRRDRGRLATRWRDGQGDTADKGNNTSEERRREDAALAPREAAVDRKRVHDADGSLLLDLNAVSECTNKGYRWSIACP